MDSRRVAIFDVQPCVDSGSVPIKRIPGDTVDVEVDLVADGHEKVGGRLLFRRAGESDWSSTPLALRVNDRYRASFEVSEVGFYEYDVEAWVDGVGTWRHGLVRKIEGGEHHDVVIHLRQGAVLFANAARRATGKAADHLKRAAQTLDAAEHDADAAQAAALDEELAKLTGALPDSEHGSRLAAPLHVLVEPRRARFSAWYEFFPRSCGAPNRHGTLRDAIERLEYAASLGFDVVYLPPIHPIGLTHRKGKNNRINAQPGEPGSPWAIGAAEGGHKSIHPELGTLEDLRTLVQHARALGVEIALDIALQTSPDHPYVREHPEWFVKRPDGSIQYSENPPKKYQDIYPLHFECPDARALWRELLSIFRFWAEQGVRMYRVDNPHTKSLAFWRFCISELRREYPDVVLLSEAFTRPKLMYALAKLGFSQSYTYFTWRNTARELQEYLTELTQTEVAEYFQPNFWPNTPDILPEHLQFGGRPAYIVRLVLAATLGASYGIYGPAFELMDFTARPGSGEYLDNEKYELKNWDLQRSDSLAPLLRRVNEIRRDHSALQQLRNLRFHPTGNDALLAYTKHDEQGVILVVVNMDFHHRQSGFVTLDLDTLGIHARDAYQAHDLLGGGRFLWSGSSNYVELDPQDSPAHIFRIRRRLRTEQDFDYFA